jgi:hypothetical protein
LIISGIAKCCYSISFVIIFFNIRSLFSVAVTKFSDSVSAFVLRTMRGSKVTTNKGNNSRVRSTIKTNTPHKGSVTLSAQDSDRVRSGISSGVVDVGGRPSVGRKEEPHKLDTVRESGVVRGSDIRDSAVLSTTVSHPRVDTAKVAPERIDEGP